MEVQHKRRFEGARWQLVYGQYSGPEAAAINELNKAVQFFVPYTVETHSVGSLSKLDGASHAIVAGTRKSNKFIDRLAKSGRIALPGKPEGYTLKCMEHPDAPGNKLLVVAGEDANGVLYGAIDLAEKILMKKCVHEDHSKRRGLFDGLKPFELTDYPRITNRGIWTWGYVIYDYRRYFDNMARLKMNMAVIWNDKPPVNSKEVIDYAHGLGIKVVFGFPWGWGFQAKLHVRADRDAIRKHVIADYKKYYQGLGLDGIYFQTLTEHTDKIIEGKTMAHWATLIANEISAELYRIDPKLYVQFGLHAISIMENTGDLKKLDPRMVIMWEDAGLIPFDYNPVANSDEFFEWSGGKSVDPLVNSAAKTLNYAKKIALLRGKKEFAMVPKGWTCIGWVDEFEHHGEFILGARRREFISGRLARRQPRWDAVNSLWLKNTGVAAKFYRDIVKLKLPVVTVAGLIEDGLFEEKIQPSAYLFGETLWDPFRSDEEIVTTAIDAFHRSNP